VIAEPPFEDGTTHWTATCCAPAVATTERGADGTVAGVPATRGVEAGEVPKELTATTSTYTVRPFARDVTVQAVVVVAEQLPRMDPPLEAFHARTRYELTGPADGAVQVTASRCEPGVTLTFVGAPGLAAGITAATRGVEGPPVPTALIATTST
jgi:hypothetical protein